MWKIIENFVKRKAESYAILCWNCWNHSCLLQIFNALFILSLKKGLYSRLILVLFIFLIVSSLDVQKTKRFTTSIRKLISTQTSTLLTDTLDGPYCDQMLLWNKAITMKCSFVYLLPNWNSKRKPCYLSFNVINIRRKVFRY